MQIIIKKKLISFNIFLSVQILSKIEITIDFNGHGDQLYYSNTQK